MNLKNWRKRNNSLSKSIKYATQGILHLIEKEPNARIHIAATILVTAIGIGLNLTAQKWFMLIAAMAMVWITEALNTALERLCDHITPERNEQIKIVKDLGTGAVLVAAMAAIAIGLLVLLS
ncbi:MAG: diacylglycerol kinase family protein [Edaphocola sp.]